MFRVPSDPAEPTMDETFKVGFWKWLFSSKTQRTEWARRRQVVVDRTTTNRLAAIDRKVAIETARAKRRVLDKAETKYAQGRISQERVNKLRETLT